MKVAQIRIVTGVALIGLVSVALVGAGITKLAHAGGITKELETFGFAGPWIIFLGAIEIVSAVSLAVPRTRALGLLLITGFLGGAIATHLQHGQPPFAPAVLLALGWIGVRLRHPAADWSHSRRARTA